MPEQFFKIDAYLERIRYEGKTDASIATLQGLHLGHTLNVPFENLDIYYGKPILLDPESLYKKIVVNKRGGYCFEMNGLFSFVLKELGFKVTDLLARVTVDGVTYQAKNHQVILVEIAGRKWLADVGFGRNGITAPLLLEEVTEQEQFGQYYRFRQDDKLGWVLQNKVLDEYQAMYAFTLEACYPVDYEMSNFFTSNHPESRFVRGKFCTMPTETGRITLTEEHFKVIAKGQVREMKLTHEDEFDKLLRKHFALDDA